ncbi:HAD family hydrolase [Shewanella benthica]|nr:HAD family hydrolase [Shewanella benthica]
MLDDPRSYPYSLKNEFNGTFYELLRSRFLISNSSIQQIFGLETQQTTISLPKDLNKVRKVLLSNQKALTDLIEPTKTAYLKYLNSIGATKGLVLHLVDVGYSGTIQKLMTLLLEKDTVGHYLISSKPGVHQVKGNTATMKGCLQEGVKLRDGYIPLDRSMFLEALMTAPNGQFQDIRMNELIENKFDFYYGRQVNAQKYFHELEQVMNGAIEHVNHCAYHGIAYSGAEVETIYSHYVTYRNMIPRSSHHLFAIDDDVAGNGTVDSLQFFGLK